MYHTLTFNRTPKSVTSLMPKLGLPVTLYSSGFLTGFFGGGVGGGGGGEQRPIVHMELLSQEILKFMWYDIAFGSF